MVNLNLIVSAETLRVATSGSIWGDVCLQLDRQRFPGSAWNDLAVEFVAFWLTAAQRLRVGESRRERVAFLDGPYYADLSTPISGNEEEVRIDLVEEREGVAGIRHTAIVDIHWMFADGVRVARATLAVCQQKGWANAEVTRLAEAVREASK